MKTYEQFVEFYEKSGLLDMGTWAKKPTKPLNPRQIETAYKQYLHKVDMQNKKERLRKEAEPSKDSVVSKQIRERDGNACRLLRVLTFSEYEEWKMNHGGQDKIIDAAHVFGKNSHPWMRYDLDNVVCLNRFSHISLDTHRSPLNGKMISVEEHEYWWKRIVGETVWLDLLERSRRN